MAPNIVTLLVVTLAVAAAATVIGWLGRRRITLFPWETGLLYVNGRFAAVLGPGRHWADIAGRTVIRMPTSPQSLSLAPQEMLTADGFPVKLSLVVDYRIDDPRRTRETTGGDYIAPLHTAAQLALRAAVQTRGLDALLADRNALEPEIAPIIAKAAAAIGVAIEKVALRDLILPAEVRRMVTEVERARREGLAALERARGEQAALRSLANAARLMKGNPELHALRVLQSLSSQPGRPAPTIVLGAGSILPMPAAGAEAPPPAED